MAKTKRIIADEAQAQAFLDWQIPLGLDTGDISVRQLEDWRERCMKHPAFVHSKAIDIAFRAGYGENWPAVAVLHLFPDEAHLRR